MENSRLKERILMEIEKIIAHSSARGKMTKKVQCFHEALIQKHYNATDVKIDYHRHRVNMNLVLDESGYDCSTVNLNLPILPMNLFFQSLSAFLKSCIQYDTNSIAFYAKLLKDFSSKNKQELVC
ncbi:hypothetical protein [uncultured Croceitalea sp.]|uniref:hypothetical protein n=1 Tax=uncultured Croceitalea sp. TaxID=1798908 RepID=UPI003305D463